MTTPNYQLLADPKYGFMRVTPAPSDAEIEAFYAAEFYSGEYKNFNNSSLAIQERDPEFQNLHRELLLEEIERARGASIKDAAVLDIGCGWGLTLKFLAARGAKGYGFDPSTEAVDWCRSQGLDVVQGGVNRLDHFNEKRFDVVLMQNVLEHLKDPETVVRGVYEILKPGGIFVCAVPNDFSVLQECAVERLGLRQWWVAPPAHLSYFGSDSLAALLKGTGFDLHVMESSFPLEAFLLMGDDYISKPELGRDCHQKRVNFELALDSTGRRQQLRQLYRALAGVGMGRILTAYAVRR